MSVDSIRNQPYREEFLRASDDWVCDLYSLDIRYIALRYSDQFILFDAVVSLNPLPPKENRDFRIETTQVALGHAQVCNVSKDELHQFLQNVAHGRLEVHGQCYELPLRETVEIYSEMGMRERWFCDLHLRVSGARQPMLSVVEFSVIDNQLRRSTPPFDGLGDALGWLGLAAPDATQHPPSIEVRVGPPVDLITNLCKLTENKLKLVIYAHPHFDVEKVAVTIRVVPGEGLASRRHVTSEFHWTKVDDRWEGVAQFGLQNADGVLVMLLVGDTTVRRQWFLDAVKARNNRLVATHVFDKDIKMVRQAVLESADSSRFELGVSALLFLLGFSAAVQLETNSPDIIATTPGGRVVLIECTLRIADFSSKIGKLVDRHRMLVKAFDESNHYAEVHGVLVCGLPRDQIAVRVAELEAHGLLLISKDELVRAFDRLRFAQDPDQLIDEAKVQLNSRRSD